jgi:hypothetical protein
MSAKSLILVLAIAIVGLGVWQANRVFRNTDSKVDNDVPTSRVSMTSGAALAGDPRSILSRNPSSLDNGYQSATQPAVTPQQKAQGIQESDFTVVGRAFQMAPAIEAACRTVTKPTCDDVREKLASLAQEPRDVTWATAMESLIQQDVLSGEPGRFQIRDIECRTSLCAAEVESTWSDNGVSGSYMGGMQLGHDALRAALQTNLNTWGYETDSSGARVTVTVITFTRR